MIINAILFILAKYLPYLGFPCGSAGKNSSCNAGDLGSNPGLGRSPGEGKGSPLQYSGLENSVDYTVHGVAKSRTQRYTTLYTRLSLSLKASIYYSTVFPGTFLVNKDLRHCL